MSPTTFLLLLLLLQPSCCCCCCSDLKLDNTILDHRNPPRLKLCDFGFAKAWAANSNMDTMRIGTPEYMGPELISGRCV
jgi:serine/threonine-protein kinase SRK2